MRIIVVAVTVAVAGCGGAPPASTQQLQLSIGDAPIELQAGDSLRVQILVVGAGADSATISSPDLPRFATLQRSTLMLSPGREYEGDYAFTLVAATSSETATTTARVHVSRWNTGPAVSASQVMMADSVGVRDPPTCPSAYCTLDASAGLAIVVDDEEADTVTVEVELVRTGEPFSGIATYAVTAPVGVPQNPVCNAAFDRYHTCILVPFEGITTGYSYSFAVRVRDALGAPASWGYGVATVDGWEARDSWRFNSVPCSDPGCFCLPTQSITGSSVPCSIDADCCSGTCAPPAAIPFGAKVCQ